MMPLRALAMTTFEWCGQLHGKAAHQPGDWWGDNHGISLWGCCFDIALWLEISLVIFLNYYTMLLVVLFKITGQHIRLLGMSSARLQGSCNYYLWQKK